MDNFADLTKLVSYNKRCVVLRTLDLFVAPQEQGTSTTQAIAQFIFLEKFSGRLKKNE